MSKLQFKTSIACGGCVAKVKKVLDAEVRIQKWDVDLSSPEKTLTVESETITPEEIVAALGKIGFKAEQK